MVAKRQIIVLAAMIVTVLAIALAPSAAIAGPLQDGIAAYDRGDYAAALKSWSLAAEQGNVEAQYNLGLLYANGLGVPQDYGEALQWWRLAADQGFALAQHNLGAMYAQGLGVPRDMEEARRWRNLAAQPR